MLKMSSHIATKEATHELEGTCYQTASLLVQKSYLSRTLSNRHLTGQEKAASASPRKFQEKAEP